MSKSRKTDALLRKTYPFKALGLLRKVIRRRGEEGVGVDWKQEELLHLILTLWSVEKIVGKRKRE